MPLWREKRHNCFYCGCRSAKVLPANTRRWKCTRCDAVNHLDEDGGITHPPTAASQPETRFARSRPRAESPSGLNAEADTPFCGQCLNNQRITNDILANYDPPETHDWEDQYKQYVKALQETYPPVCDDCEDRIRSKMQQSDYFVSAENLGRSLVRDDGNESWLYRRGWQYNLLSLILTLGKLMWWTSWMGQFLWHALNLFKSKRHDHRLEIGTAQPPFDCFRRIFSSGPLPATCDDFFTSLAGWSLVLGLLSVWWNPLLVKKLQLIYGRAMNKLEYYELQVIFVLLRWGFWASFEKIANMEIGPQRWMGYHAFAMAICVLSAVLPLRAIQWDSTPRIGRSYSPGSLLAQKPREPRRLSRPKQPDFLNQPQSTPDRGRSERMNQRFPIDRLATTPQQHFTPRNVPPTPPPEEDNEEAAMDWQPTRQFNFQPTTSYRDSKQTPTRNNAQKSPFYGQLPPNVVSPAHALRNPPFQPAPLQRASAQQNNFFNRNDTKLSHPFGNRRIFDDDESSLITSPAKSSFSPISFQNQRFFPSNVSHDTGLEDLFAKATTLKHDPNQPTAQQGDGDDQDSPTRAATRALWLPAPILAIPTVLAIIVLALAVQLVFYENFIGDILFQGAGKARCIFGGEGCE